MTDPPDNNDHPNFDLSNTEDADINTYQQNIFSIQDDEFYPPVLDLEDHIDLVDTEYVSLGNDSPLLPNISQPANQIHVSLSDHQSHVQNDNQIQNQQSFPTISQPLSNHLQTSLTTATPTSNYPKQLAKLSTNSTKRPRSKTCRTNQQSSIKQPPRPIAPRSSDTKSNDNPSTPVSMQTSSRPSKMTNRLVTSTIINQPQQHAVLEESPACAISPDSLIAPILPYSHSNPHLSQLGLSPQNMIPLKNIGHSMYPVQRQQPSFNLSSPQQKTTTNQTNSENKQDISSNPKEDDQTNDEEIQPNQPESKKMRMDETPPSSSNKGQNQPTTQHQQQQQPQIPIIQPQIPAVSLGLPLTRHDLMYNMSPNLQMQLLLAGRYQPGLLGQIPPNNATVPPPFIYAVPTLGAIGGIGPDQSQIRMNNDTSSTARTFPQTQLQPSQQQNLPSGHPVVVSEDGTQVQRQSHARLEKHSYLGRLQLRNMAGGNLALATSTTSGSDVVGGREGNQNQNVSNRAQPENAINVTSNVLQDPNQSCNAEGSQGRFKPRSQKKQRLVWTPDLHERFLKAIDAVSLANAVPKTLVAIMNVDGLTTEHVKSHLQKYRNSLQKEANEEGKEAEKSPDDNDYNTDIQNPTEAMEQTTVKTDKAADSSGNVDGMKRTPNANTSQQLPKFSNRISIHGTPVKDETIRKSEDDGDKVEKQPKLIKSSSKGLQELSPIHERRRRAALSTTLGMTKLSKAIQPSTGNDNATDKKEEDSKVVKNDVPYGTGKNSSQDVVSEHSAREVKTELNTKQIEKNKQSELNDSMREEVVNLTQDRKSKKVVWTEKNTQINDRDNEKDEENANSSTPFKTVEPMDIELAVSADNESNLDIVKNKVLKLQLLVQQLGHQVNAMERNHQKKHGSNKSGGGITTKGSSIERPIEADSGTMSADIDEKSTQATETLQAIEGLKKLGSEMHKVVEESFEVLNCEMEERRESIGSVMKNDEN